MRAIIMTKTYLSVTVDVNGGASYSHLHEPQSTNSSHVILQRNWIRDNKPSHPRPVNRVSRVNPISEQTCKRVSDLIWELSITIWNFRLLEGTYG